MTKSKTVKEEKKLAIQVKRSRISGKKRVDLFSNLRNTEHPLDNILPDPNALQTGESRGTSLPTEVEQPNISPEKYTQTVDIQDNITLTSLTSQTSQSSQSFLTAEIAPTKNYHKVSNTITRQAIPEGLFVGKSKQLYDVLYALTRGAITPTRKIRISKTKLMKQSHIGSRITFDSCIDRLTGAGLLKISVFTGEHEGNEFEIFLPEEIETETLTSLTSQPTLTSQTSPAQKLVRLVSLETSQTSQSLNDENKEVYENPKTLLKTEDKTVDDESPLDLMARKFEELARKHTGKNLLLTEREKWAELAALLALEFELAAARTNSISSIPAFLTEHLRRRLFPKPAQTEKGISKSLKVGKPANLSEETEIYIAEPLTEEGREAVLKTIKSFIDEGKTEFVEGLEKTYTAEDWAWITQELAKTKPAE